MFNWHFGWTWTLPTGYTLIKLKRLDATDQGIFGHLTMDDFDCVTLENHNLNIPVGIYKVTLYDSPSHGCKVPWVHVPGREYIEIHPGNYEKDSKGCILVGETRDGFAVDNSRTTFQMLMAKWPMGEVEIQIS